ncbi:hypothetical protein F5Y04DRAFT_208321 [Hypomontagnella monticulosa]|nr:hypothetical protein F5Y04DRAFT_208321 [Hypomontagnella monticulosa]
MGTYHGIQEGVQFHNTPTDPSPIETTSPTSIDTKYTSCGQGPPAYQAVEIGRKASFDSLLLDKDNQDASTWASSDPQSHGIERVESAWERVKRFWHYGWVVEIFGIALAIISLMSIFIALQCYKGQEAKAWPLFITLNSFIAVFTVLLKAGIAVPLSEGISQLKWQWFEQNPRRLVDMHEFDEASRDAWTSLLFIFRIDSMREFTVTKGLARFAAFVMVLAFAADPFSQQIIEYVDCPQVSTDVQVAIARTNNYVAQGGHVGAGESDIDSPMAVAIITGLVDPPPNPATLVNVDCVSGNCTFPRFQTIGVCHTCQDISRDVQNMTGKPGSSPPPIKNYTLLDADGDVQTWIGMGTVFSTSAPVRLESMSHLMELKILSAPDRWAGPPAAFACQMYPCVRTYDAGITNTVRKETVLESERMGQNQLYFPDQERSLFKLASSSALHDGVSAPCERSDSPGEGLVKVALANIDAAPDTIASNNDKVDSAYYPASCVWTFGFSSADVIKRQLASELDDAHMQMTGGVTTGPIVAKNIWRNGTADLGSVDTFVRNLTDVMTATIRNRGMDGSAEYAPGEVLVNSTCVGVRWAWFSYPVILVFFALVFFGLLVLHTPAGSAPRLWKSSSLALLFSNVDEPIAKSVGFGSSHLQMKEVAKVTTAQLVRDDDGRARFVGNSLNE